jgi:integrase/recombinase XerC
MAEAATIDAKTVSGYLAYLLNEKRYSPLTAENYARDLRHLFELIGDTPFADIQSHHIRRFIGQLHSSGLSGRTLARVLSAWRGFFHYLIREHGLLVNPCVGLRAPKSPKALPDTLSPDEAVHLVEMKAETPLDVRDKAMFELLYSSGLRLAEMVNLDPIDLDFADASVRVTGKGNKTRIVPLGSHAIAALQHWFTLRASLAKPEETAVFVGKNGKRIAHRTVQHQLRQWGIKQGIASNVHPHLLRHSFATHVLQSSGDLRAVQEMLGHASISSTQIYTHLDFQYLSKTYDSAHPRAKKKL